MSLSGETWYDKKMIKALLFDYGGVIADDSEGKNLYKKLAVNLAISPKVAWEMLHPLWREFSRGRITEAEVWSKLEQQYGKSIPVTKRAIWNSWDKMPCFQDMLGFVAELQNDGYITGIISTTITDTAEDIRAHGGYDLFSPIILSCDVGFAKPDPEIYDIAMERLSGILPEQVIFLDDREMCLAPARALGIQTVLVENPAQAIHDTKELLQRTA